MGDQVGLEDGSHVGEVDGNAEGIQVGLVDGTLKFICSSQ